MNVELELKARVFDETYQFLGEVDLREEEINHFDSTGSVPARIALDEFQIEGLGITEDTYVFVRGLNYEQR